MDIERLKKNPQIFVAFLMLIFLLFPWIRVSAWGANESLNAFMLFFGGYFGVLLLIPIPVALVGMSCLSIMGIDVLGKFERLLYIGAAAFQFVITIAVTNIIQSMIKTETYYEVSSYVGLRITKSAGFWLMLAGCIGVAACVAAVVLLSSTDRATGNIDTEALKENLNINNINTEEIRDQVSNVVSGVKSTLEQVTSTPAPSGYTPPARKCPQCHAFVGEEAKFCVACGTVIPDHKSCPNCHSKVNPDSKFCPECGKAIYAEKAEELVEGATEEIRCKSCNELLDEDARFCTHCGTAV